jgi:hypothetical protein
MLSPRSILAKLMFLAAALSWTPQTRAFPGYYSSGAGTTQACTACHSPTVTTCNGCHAHGTHATSSKSSVNLVASTDKATYAPGETVTVTVTGGYQSGWVRVNLYHQNMDQLARSSCPGGLGGCTTSVLPVTLTAPAPMNPGTYTWRASWYGNVHEAASGFTSPACGDTVTPPCFRVDTGNNAAGAVHGEEIVAVSQFTVAAAPTGPTISVAPATLAFGDVTVGASGSQTFTISNTGTATLTGSVAFAAGTSSEFGASPTTFSIAAGGQPVTVTATYVPTGVGADSGALVVTSNDAASPTVDVSVSGTGVEQGQTPQGDDDDDGGCSSGGSVSWLAVVALALVAARRVGRVRRIAG